MTSPRQPLRTTFTLLASLALAAAVVAQTPPRQDTAAASLQFAVDDLGILYDFLPLERLPADLAVALLADLEDLGVPAEAGFYDLRGDRWGTLLLSRPMIPGPGIGNSLTWADLGIEEPRSEAELRAAVSRAFLSFLGSEAAALRIDPSEVRLDAVSVHEGGRLVQINAGRTVGGVPVRFSRITAVLNSGNLVLFGTRGWGDVDASTVPAIPASAAVDAVASYVEAAGLPTRMRGPALELAILENGDDPAAVPAGEGYRHRLVWVVGVTFDGDHGTYEAWVDAQTGELLAFADRNSYADRNVVGGVFPVSNDGETNEDGVPDGFEQPGWPMPFADITLDGGERLFTDSGGVLSCTEGTITTHLDGPFVRMNDNCGAIDESSAAGDLDLGTSGGTDCVVPSGHSPGDTHASRTGFFEVNRIKEKARSYLPDNVWLDAQLTANMNIDNNCNAFWNGSTINFYTSGGGCANTGEIAAVFDHEWGHGMDANDANPGISVPGEAPADMYAFLRLNDSCIGRGFLQNGVCGGNGDACTVCSGVRDVDFARRSSGLPHDIAWVLSPVVSPGVPGVAPPGGCVGSTVAIPVLQTGPCMQGTHCEGSMVSEAVWDLIHRDLQGFEGSAFGLDTNTALNLVSRLQYLGGGNVFFWYQCNPTGTGGCNSDGGYMNYLAVDDDNGSLLDGTPHMTAIFSAFERHQLACPAPLPTDSGCADAPATAPNVSVAPIDNGAHVTWNAVPGATEYWVYRTDGLHGCEFGKERVAITTATEHVDTGLLNGRTYFYTVEAVGTSPSCRSAASACQSVVPSAGAGLQLVAGSQAFVAATGDGDAFLDNCEEGDLSFGLRNSGSASLTNVRIVSASSPSHPETSFPGDYPIAVADSLPSCGELTAAVPIRAGGLAHKDTVRFRLEVTSDELAPVAIPLELAITDAESDFEFHEVKTYAFDELGNFESWELIQGTYRHLPGGPPQTTSTAHLASSTAQDNSCDQIRSPLVRLTEDSTLSLYNNFSIEPPLAVFGNAFYDRANVGLVEPASGERTTVSPDGGRPYNASGPNGTCVTQDQPGWADVEPTWEESTWSSTALGAPGLAGIPVHLDVAYGTDPLVSGAGFWFDHVTVTQADHQVPDAQPDDCPPVEPCDEIDDGDAAVEYRRGWHRRSHPDASGGGYHRRMGGNGSGNGASPTARIEFTGGSITYHFALSDIGGTADVFLDGALVETLSYDAGGGTKKEEPTFGHSRSYDGLGEGSHELLIEHRSGAVYVDGFTIACDGAADPEAAEFHSETSTSTASATEGLVIERTVEVGDRDEEVSVVVEGALVALTVNLLDPSGGLVASGEALVDGLTVSGVDAPVATAGTYTVQVLNTDGAFETIEISVARTVRNP